MQIINTQYEVIKQIHEDKYGNTVIVKDMQTGGGMLKRLRIINHQRYSESFLDYMKHNFYIYKNLVHPGLADFYFFNIISSIDAKAVFSNKYYYTYENIEGQNLFDFIKGKDLDAKLDMAVQLCAAVKYLHLRDFLLCNINPADLTVESSAEGYKLRIEGLPFINGTDMKSIIDKDNGIFIAPEVIIEDYFTLYSDIYLIGMIMLYIFSEYGINSTSFKYEPEKFLPRESSELHDIAEIIRICTAEKPEDRYQGVEAIVEAINKAYGKEYKVIDKKYLQTLPKYNFKLIGREPLIDEIISDIKDFYNEDSQKRTVIIKGKRGTGKDVFLKILTNRTMSEGIQTLSRSVNRSGGGDFSLITSLVKDLIKIVDKELIDKYASDLSVLIPGLSGKNLHNEFKDIQQSDDINKLRSRVGSFILEASKKYKIVVTISNFEWVDKSSLDIINSIIKSKNNSSIYIAVTINTDNAAENMTLCENCEDWANEGYANFIDLGNFSIGETLEYLQFLLGTQNVPYEFAANIYNETEGNPSYIYEIIYILFVNNNIYIDDSGNWVFDRINLESLNLSHNIDDIIINKLNNLEAMQQEVLKVLSIFNMTVSSDILEDIMELRSEDLFGVLTKLVAINILSRRIDDWGFSYSFSSANFKKYIYDKIPDDEKFRLHEKASYILEDKFVQQERDNKDELIYHMTLANRRDEAISYLMVAAEEMIRSNMLNQAVEFLEKAYFLFDPAEKSRNKIIVCMKLGRLYGKLGDNAKSLMYYNVVEKLSLECDEPDSRLLIDVYIKKFTLLYEISNERESIDYARKAKRLLRAVDYPEGLYKLLINMFQLMGNRRRYKSYESILEKALNVMDKDKYHYYYAQLLGIYGLSIYRRNKLSNEEQAIELLMKSVELLEKLGAYNKLPPILNGLGVIYSDIDRVKAKEYLEKNLTISQKTNNRRYIERSYNNLAYISSTEDKCKEAMEFYEKALEVTKISGRYIMPTLYINMASLGIDMDDYKKAADYMDKCDNLLKTSKDAGDTAEYYYTCLGNFYYKIGEYDKAADAAQRAMDLCQSWGLGIDSEAMLVKTIAGLEKKRTLELSDYDVMKEIYDLALSEVNYKIVRVACIRFAEILIDRGERERAEEYLRLGEQYIDEIDTDVLRLEYGYISALLERDSNKKIESLTSLVKLAEIVESSEFDWKIYRAIGREQYEIRSYYDSLKNYITSLYSLKKLVENVPEQYKSLFVVSHNRSRVRKELARTADMIKGGMDFSSDIEDGPVKNFDRYFDDSQFKNIYKNRKADSKQSDARLQGNFALNLHEMLNRFKDDSIKNLNHIIELCAESAQAKNAFIATVDDEGRMHILASYNKYDEIPFHRYIIDQASIKKQPIIITDAFEYSRQSDDLIIPKEITAVFCMPIDIYDDEDECDSVMDAKKVKESNKLRQPIGYLYMDTDSIINNFTAEMKNVCNIINKIAYVMVDNHNLKISSSIDKLTKLYTRKYFELALENEIRFAEKENRALSIIMIDIDKFKSVNDRFGHQKGDEILQNVSSILLNNVRKNDICGRYGGEEIIIILPSATSTQAFNVAEKLRKKVENAKLLGLNNSLTISLGVASYPEHSIWIKDLIEKADQALYNAKESGRNKSCVYDPNIASTVKRIDKIAGIISGNLVEDQRNVETLLEILEIQRNSATKNTEKIFNFLGRVIEVSEAQTGIVFMLDDKDGIVNKIGRRKYVDKAVDDINFNESVVRKCIENQNGEYLLDWDNYSGIDPITNMPEWQSIIILPFINKSKLRGVLYLSVAIRTKEFDANIFNFIKTLCDIISPVF